MGVWGAGEAGRADLSFHETWVMGPWRPCLRPLPPRGQVNEQADLRGGWGGEEKNEPQSWGRGSAQRAVPLGPKWPS